MTMTMMAAASWRTSWRPRGLLALALAAWAIAGCTNGSAQGPSGAGWFGGGDGDSPRPVNPFAALLRPAPDTSGGTDDGAYSILLYVCRSPAGHVNQAKRYKDATEKDAGWKHLFIVHKDDHSLLYWGKYRMVQDAQPNLKTAKAYRAPAGVNIYGQAIVVPLPGHDVGPAEWNVAAIQPRYLFTVLCAVFYDVPEANYVGRKQFAVDYCKQLREQGIEAYYRHDPAQSIVTVGAFEPSAVAQVRKGKQVDTVVRDQRVAALFKRFPHLAVNGRQRILHMINTQTGKPEDVPASTYLMEIPREKPTHAASTQPGASGHLGLPQPRQNPGDTPGPGRPAGGSGGPGSAP